MLWGFAYPPGSLLTLTLTTLVALPRHVADRWLETTRDGGHVVFCGHQKSCDGARSKLVLVSEDVMRFVTCNHSIYIICIYSMCLSISLVCGMRFQSFHHRHDGLLCRLWPQVWLQPTSQPFQGKMGAMAWHVSLWMKVSIFIFKYIYIHYFYILVYFTILYFNIFY